MSFSWLHISDFHFRGGDPYDRDVVLRALIKAVKHFRENGRRADVIFATGDIAYSGQKKEYRAASDFFNSLIQAADIDKRALFVIPGNHDVDRYLGIGLSRTLESSMEATAYFEPGKPKPHLTQKLRAFSEWYNEYFAGIREFPMDSTCGPVEAVDISGTKIGVIPLNTALFCADEEDHAKLWIGRRCLDAEIKHLESLGAMVSIALMHHPVEWLSEHEAENIRGTLQTNVHFVLSGHLHRTDATVIEGITGKSLHLVAGATYQGSARRNRALYATIDGQSVTIFPICYHDGPEEVWTLDTTLYPHEPGHQRTLLIPRLKDDSNARPDLVALDFGQRRKITESNRRFEVLKQGHLVQLRFLDTGATYIIDYGPIRETIRLHFPDASEFDKLLEREFLGHRIMLDYDYEHMGIPLLDGLTVFISKRGDSLTLDFLTKLQLSGTLLEAWEHFLHSYRVTLRLEYRKKRDELLKRRVRRISIERVADLVHRANRFFIGKAKITPEPIHQEFFDRKRLAEVHLARAESAAKADFDLGDLVRDLESTISYVHKMMLYSAKYWKMRDWSI